LRDEQETLDRNPHHINEDCWFYEANGGIEVFHKEVGMVLIPIASIRAYIRRKDKED